MERGYLQISFAWMFAIIVGAFILFLAIYAAVKVKDIGEYELNTKTAKTLGILLNPLEIGFETAKSNSIELPTETRIYNGCNTGGDFGKQLIRISQKSFNKWPEPSDSVGFENKYIFSEKQVEGKEFYLFSKPFEFPFKVSDLIYLTSSDETYCFIGAPDDIADELSGLRQKNMLVDNCSGDSVKVCFGFGNDCDITVNYNMQNVKKENKIVYFEGDSLMYAAIFSDPDIYECQVKRLMKKVDILALLYNGKAEFILERGCSSNLNLIGLSNIANLFEKSSDLTSVNNLAEEIGNKNDLNGDCKLW